MKMQLKANSVEKFLLKILPYFFTIVFITTVAGAISGYLEHNSWKMGDWLINYQGGMIRRGFLGEIIYQLSHLTHINPGLYVVIFQSFFYAVFLFFSYCLLRKQHLLLPYALLIFSPFIFTFQINDLQGGFRKEIIYFAILSFVAWSAKSQDHKKFEPIFYVVLLLYPAVILTHEMLAIYLPFLLVAYLLVTTLTPKKILLILILLLPSIISFLIVIHYSGASSQVAKIFDSIATENYPLSGGAISWLDKDTAFGIERVANYLEYQDYVYYFFLLPLAVIAYIPIFDKLISIIKNKLSVLLILISLIGSFGLFVVAIDWGRFIYIPLVSIFILSLIPDNRAEKHLYIARKQQAEQAPFISRWISIIPKGDINIFIAILFIAYTLFWYMPHCCSPKYAFSRNYKQLNAVAFFKPYAKIAIHYFPSFKTEK